MCYQMNSQISQIEAPPNGLKMTCIQGIFCIDSNLWVFRRWGIVSSSCVCCLVLSCCLQYQLFQLNSLAKMGLSLVVMCKSCASHVPVMFKSCSSCVQVSSSHVQVMYKSCQFSHRLGDWKVFSLVLSIKVEYLK